MGFFPTSLVNYEYLCNLLNSNEVSYLVTTIITTR